MMRSYRITFIAAPQRRKNLPTLDKKDKLGKVSLEEVGKWIFLRGIACSSKMFLPFLSLIVSFSWITWFFPQPPG